MPLWRGKSSCKEDKKKASKGLIDVIQRKFRNVAEERCNRRSEGSRRRTENISERGFLSRVPSRSPSPSARVSRCQSFIDRPHAQPLPLPGMHLGRTNSGIIASSKPGYNRGSEQLLFLPQARSGCVPVTDAETEIDLNMASFSTDSSTDSEDQCDSRLLSPLTSDYENGNRTAMNSPSSTMHQDHCLHFNPKNTAEVLKPLRPTFNNQNLSTSPKQGPLRSYVQNIQIPNNGGISNPDSSMSSPSRSPMRGFGPEHGFALGKALGKTHSDVNLLGSGHCSPGSGHNSGHNSVCVDMSMQHLRPNWRYSPECSPSPSPRMTSPGPSSRTHSSAVTPLHPRAGGTVAESTSTRHEDGKQQSHRLPLPPLPPITISNTSPFSPAYSASTSPTVPRSPSRAENPINSASRWKKGRLLGRGTFGHVYLGFNSESGEMCAMKEVTLFDDAKSKESAQQLRQEILLLSRLRHPNIVRYYDSETVDDKLYIYLEYVSGGSIYKLLQEYGQLGESAIRSYTHQILWGLAYLHAKKTIHRDIKGANILVDPSGRVKLADFGMAKHITGQSCPLSFKGSPYWMAPEVIRNASGCNLAVDIWSLGCTVLEMATTKPPWSQFEGVAAMFKIGNSKELPTIPDHLSEEGKDFVRQCLQRNPALRPTAAQLLEHPFVKTASPLERPTTAAEQSEALPALINTLSSLGIGDGRNMSGFESNMMFNHQSKGFKTGSGTSEAHTPRNVSCPVSPIGSPLLHSRTPQPVSGRMSPSPISSPHATSGPSTPLTGGNGAIPFHHKLLRANYLHECTNYLHEGFGMSSRPQTIFCNNGSTLYQEPKPDLLRGVSQASHVFREMVSSDNNAFGNQLGSSGHRNFREPYDGQSVLADRVSQQLSRDHMKRNPSLDLNLSSPLLGGTNGII